MKNVSAGITGKGVNVCYYVNIFIGVRAFTHICPLILIKALTKGNY